jgi:hypothetical protein
MYTTQSGKIGRLKKRNDSVLSDCMLFELSMALILLCVALCVALSLLYGLLHRVGLQTLSGASARKAF